MVTGAVVEAAAGRLLEARQHQKLVAVEMKGKAYHRNRIRDSSVVIRTL